MCKVTLKQISPIIYVNILMPLSKILLDLKYLKSHICAHNFDTNIYNVFFLLHSI